MDESIYGMNLVIFTHYNEKKSGVSWRLSELPPHWNPDSTRETQSP
mgnify:CR=1 FL=1